MRARARADGPSPAGLAVAVGPGGAAGAVIVQLCGELDYATVEQFREVVAAQFDRGATGVTLELSGLGFVDSSGLGAIVSAHKTAARRGAAVVLHAPGPALRRVLQLTGLDTVFVITGPAAF